MEDETLSVSKGVFIFKNNFKPSTKRERYKKASKSFNSGISNSLFATKWYEQYNKVWYSIEDKILTINEELFSSVLSNLIDFVKACPSNNTEIPTAALFTGINMPDHTVQFETLSKQLKLIVTPHVAQLHSQDCVNIKYIMESMINQFVNEKKTVIDEDESYNENSQIRKTQLNMSLLQCWYNDLYKNTTARKLLVIIIPDFESFNLQVIQKFILIISCFSKELPFVLIFGIATDTNILHSSLSYKAFSKMRIKIFNSQSSVEYLNHVLENVVFTKSCPFQLGGKVFNLFIELFLFYDLSVTTFIQNVKYACADHFSFGNAMSLCHSSYGDVKDMLKIFTSEDFENVRELKSFKKLVESEPKEIQTKLLVDDNYFCQVLLGKISIIQTYIERLHLFLKCLLVLVKDLPKAPLGKQTRVLYATATTSNITQTSEYKDCMKLLNFQSKDELYTKLTNIRQILSVVKRKEEQDIVTKLEQYLVDLDNIQSGESEKSVAEKEDEQTTVEMKATSRGQFRQKLLELTKQPSKLNKYEKLREGIMAFISDLFEKYLEQPESYYFHEIFFYNNMAVKNYVIGSHRSAIHNALSDPYFYLRCGCCKATNSSSIKPTMPDISIAYKLHLEYGTMINLYDWLQSFLSIVDPEIDAPNSTKIVVKPELQARFTQAVAELEYLGFIKSSKKKADHVQRLTWGAS